jgi:hypothetical protein
MSLRTARAAALVAASLGLMFAVSPLHARERVSEDGLWTFLADDGRPSADARAWPVPGRHRVARFDQGVLAARLSRTPTAAAARAARVPGEEVTFPLPDGTFQRFLIVEVPILGPKMAAEHPGIRTYAGQGIDDPTATVRCTRTVLGFQAQIRSPEGTSYVDPFWRGDERVHAVYDAAEAIEERGLFACGVEDDAGAGSGHHLRVGPAGLAVNIGTQLRAYDLILQLSGEYVQIFGGAPAAFAAATTTANNVSGILENDADVRLSIVLMRAWLDPATDPFSTTGNYCAETQAQNDSEGVPYDIGHLFAGTGYSGNACSVGNTCSAGANGGAWSTSGSPTGAAYTFLVAHEMGHQFGARHTFNGSGCNPGSWDGASAQEPGSGTTLMSYFSICGADNLLPGAPGTINLYYHRDSIERIVSYTQVGGGSGCPTTTATGNNPPTVNGGADFTIPQGTPFVLTATGGDVDGDALTYCWEQTNIAPASAAATTVDDGVIPLFRSYPPTADPTRTFPALADLLAGNLFPGTLGEQLPLTNRTLAFSVVARDNVANGGGVTSDDVQITVAAAAGPFAVTSPNGGEAWAQGSAQTVTWDVAGTDGAPINVANVRILLSTDGGLTYPTVLAASTANDGSEGVTLPACVHVTTARVRVEAIGNVFFDVSDADFSILDVTPPTVTCNVTRAVLWPATKGLLDVGLTHSAVDTCPGPIVLHDLLVHSDEPNGAPPYAPDATLVGASTRLRAERLLTADGRVYLTVPRYRDAAGNVGAGCCPVICPLNMTVGHLTALLLDASVKRAACLAAGGAAPAGTTQNLP